MSAVISLLLAIAMLASPVSAGQVSKNYLELSNLRTEIGSDIFESDVTSGIYEYHDETSSVFGLYAVEDSETVLNGAISADESAIHLTMNGGKRYFTVTWDALASILQEDIVSPTGIAVTAFDAAKGIYGSNDETFYSCLSAFFNEYLAANAVSATDYTDEIEGTELSGKTIELEISSDHLLAALDALADSSDESISATFNAVLNAVSEVLGQTDQSFSELSTAESSKSIPVTYSIGSNENSSMARQVWSTSFPVGDGTIEAEAKLDTVEDRSELTVSFVIKDVYESLSIDLDQFITSNEETDISGTCDIRNESIYPFVTVTAEGETQETAETETQELHFDSRILLSENWIFNISGTDTLITQESLESDPVSESSDFSFVLNSTLKENNARDSKVEFEFKPVNSATNEKVSFAVTGGANAYEDIFTGTEIVIDPDSDSYNAACLMLFSDAVNFFGTAEMLFNPAPSDSDDSEWLYSLISSFYDLSDSTDAEGDREDMYASDQDEEISGDTSSMTLEEAASIFSGTMPEIKMPAGYSFDAVSAEADTLSVDLIGEGDDYINIYIAEADPEGEYPNYYTNDDGSIYAVDLLYGDEEIDLYFNDCSREDADKLIHDLGFN